MVDASFLPDREGLQAALDQLFRDQQDSAWQLPSALPEDGIGEQGALERLAPLVLGGRGAPRCAARIRALGPTNALDHVGDRSLECPA